jgi:hypothetical protein
LYSAINCLKFEMMDQLQLLNCQYYILNLPQKYVIMHLLQSPHNGLNLYRTQKVHNLGLSKMILNFDFELFLVSYNRCQKLVGVIEV